jgi:hypothetical protein
MYTHRGKNEVCDPCCTPACLNACRHVRGAMRHVACGSHLILQLGWEVPGVPVRPVVLARILQRSHVLHNVPVAPLSSILDACLVEVVSCERIGSMRDKASVRDVAT